MVPARRKGVDGFSVETPASGKHPFSPSSDSLTDAWTPIAQKLCHNQAFCGLYDAQFLCCMNSSTVGQNVRQSRAWQVLDVCASRLITLTPLEYDAPCETRLSVHLFQPAINL
ncbi:hypothetical protein AVEN_16437-1 [Araneus ventricosus]|uniref:Uncharacterized protein n=1 Tax=Araneus ventricosus TaxID=182803 RepID=A0A4Y2HRV4_ARAVE|nr:hypothetical protein AVEN_16437-1 [Araneus ventricosus]